MKLILDLSCDGAVESAEAHMYVDTLRGRVAHKQAQGFPGLMMEAGDGSVWVSGVELDYGREPNPAKKPDLKLVKPLDTEPAREDS